LIHQSPWLWFLWCGFALKGRARFARNGNKGWMSLWHAERIWALQVGKWMMNPLLALSVMPTISQNFICVYLSFLSYPHFCSFTVLRLCTFAFPDHKFITLYPFVDSKDGVSDIFPLMVFLKHRNDLCWIINYMCYFRFRRKSFIVFCIFRPRSRWGCQITDAGLVRISFAKCASNLTSISLWGLTGITDEGVVQLVCHCFDFVTLMFGGDILLGMVLENRRGFILCRLLQLEWN